MKAYLAFFLLGLIGQTLCSNTFAQSCSVCVSGTQCDPKCQGSCSGAGCPAGCTCVSSVKKLATISENLKDFTTIQKNNFFKCEDGLQPTYHKEFDLYECPSKPVPAQD